VRLMKLTIDTEDALGLAVQLRATRQGVSVSDVVNAILRKTLTAELSEVSGVPPLAAAFHNLHARRRPRPANGSQRPVSSAAKFSKE
jgi:plasmid stability protein